MLFVEPLWAVAHLPLQGRQGASSKGSPERGGGKISDFAGGVLLSQSDTFFILYYLFFFLCVPKGRKNPSAFRGVNPKFTRYHPVQPSENSSQPPIRLRRITPPHVPGYCRFAGTAPGSVCTVPFPSAYTNRRLSER